MFNRYVRSGLVCLCASITLTPAARAQWAVVDEGAIAQLVQQVHALEQQVATARAQLQQAQQALQTMTGGRGMQQLLSGTQRNYLPTTWTQLTDLLHGTSPGYAGLSAGIQSALSANAILSPQRMATLTPGEQQQIQTARQSIAMQQALGHEALANASSRFAAMQSLIATIGSAGDQKAILDLQARISAELGMLQNEQTKLQVLYQSTQAQDASLREQAREQVIAGHGRFESRFQPAP
jgi:type IV secretion system protein VirB5